MSLNDTCGRERARIIRPPSCLMTVTVAHLHLCICRMLFCFIHAWESTRKFQIAVELENVILSVCLYDIYTYKQLKCINKYKLNTNR